MWLRMIGVGVGYYIAAQLSLLMAIPPGYATAFWPAAGIAVAGIVLFGYRIWPGIMAASYLVNVPTSFSAADGTRLLVSLALPAAIGAGAALQALAGGWLVRHYARFPDPNDPEWGVAKLLILAGPGSCWISASVGILTLWSMGQIAAEEIPFSWWTWWVGDSIGAFLVTPLILLWAASRSPGWLRRACTVSLPLGVLAVLIVGLFVFIERREQERLRVAFEFQTEILTRALENRVDYVLQGLIRVQRFHGKAANTTDQEKFAKAAKELLKVKPSVHAVTWTPRIRDDERIAFEKAGKLVIQEFHGDTLTPARVRPEYFPILYREPPPQAKGFDVASEDDRREALQRAGATGEPIASRPIPHLHNGDKKSILFFLPIYRDNLIPAAGSERGQDLLGFVIAIVQMDTLMEVAWRGALSEGIDLSLFDANGPPESRMAFRRLSPSRSHSGKGDSQGLVRTTEIDVAGRRWNLEFATTPEYLATRRSLQAWVVLAGGMLGTGLLGAVLLVVTGRTELVAGLVDKRTAELAAANAVLKQEIAERQRVEDELRGREESLRQSEDRFRRFVEGTTDYAIFMVDTDGRIVSWNAGAERMYGYRTEEIVGKSLDRFFTDADARSDKTAAELAAALKNGRVEDEGWRVRQDGSRFWGKVVLTPFHDRTGRLRGFWKIIHDLTERKRIEEKFRGLLESAPDAVVIVQDDGRIALVNRQAESLFGYARAELLGQPVEKLMPDRFRNQHVGFRGGYFANPAVRPMGATLNLFGLRKDGSEFPVEISLSPLVTDEGVLVSGAIRDTTDRKRAEAALEEAQRFMHRIADMTPSILYVYDMDAQSNIFVNRRLDTFLGYAWEDERPTMPTLLRDIHPEDLPRTEWANEQFQNARDGTVIETEFRIRHANGDWHWLNCRNMVFSRDADGNPTQILGSAQDITDRKRLEQEILEIASSEQRRIGQELHDGTGQELTGLCMLADNLADALSNVAPAEAQTALRITRGLRETLGQVRLLSRGLVPVEVDAEGLMAALAELAQRISDLHSVRCTFQAHKPVLVENNNTATQLYRIAQEAITNAIKHGRSANIRISLDTHGDYITLKIADDGVGIAPTDEADTGIGLRIMNYRAGQIGGYVTVRSGPAGGTVVACTLYGGGSHE